MSTTPDTITVGQLVRFTFPEFGCDNTLATVLDFWPDGEEGGFILYVRIRNDLRESGTRERFELEIHEGRVTDWSPVLCG